MDLDSCSSSRFEVSPYNPLARRRPGGIWNEDTLPVTAWEDAEHRVVLPLDLQEDVGIPNAALRWKQTKRDSVLRRHLEAVPYLDRIPELMQKAQYRGLDTRPGRESEYLFVFSDGSTRLKIVIGEYDDGWWNIITVYGPRNERDVRRWQRMFDIP